MSTLSRIIRTPAMHPTATPIALDADAMPGAQVMGDDGLLYTSQKTTESAAGYSWVSFADVARTLPANRLDIMVVDSGAETVGSQYLTIGKALEWASTFFVPYNPDWQTDGVPKIRIIIESGKVIEEQINVTGLAMPFVSIVAEDATVSVDATQLTKVTDAGRNLHAFITASAGAVAPFIEGVVFTPTGIVPQDPDLGSYTPKSCGLYVRPDCRASLTNRLYDLVNAETLLSPDRPAGFEDWTTNLFIASGGQALANFCTFNDAAEVGIQCNGRFASAGNTATGCGDHGLAVSRGEATISSIGAGAGNGYAGVFGQDFRKTPGISVSTDIELSAGGTIYGIDNARGGYNVTKDTWSATGVAYS